LYDRWRWIEAVDEEEEAVAAVVVEAAAATAAAAAEEDAARWPALAALAPLAKAAAEAGLSRRDSPVS